MLGYDAKYRLMFFSKICAFLYCRTIGIGDCPVAADQLNTQTVPFSLRELGGLFIILLVGLLIAFIVAGIEFMIEHFPMYRQWKGVS